ncbi:uncharacterized protein PV07_05239 [Cladophialophora immunda]|uniref:Enoyl reductase (ER) domain-containing protein n=1 Tax=Cladophialophora immunda TaxID=569365 RepID=A0A0D2D0W2_9EURO|nr:uncharacterized protein PV07_05239 [Cladophialophora immunda]KIW29424.1 hypothetical protein PV07_05239 [Cladophialophora immunda]OQV09347.1 hypothetical protein CLAIMM_13477 [Cladophialophora immunda]
MATVTLPKTMAAWQKHLPSKELLRLEVLVPTPNEAEILVKIEAAGVCHSDYALKQMEALPPEFLGWKPNFTMGHEGCGQIVACGAAVKSFKPGDKVAIMCVPGCGGSTCPECSRGVPQICHQGPHYGGGHDGFFADYAVVPERAAVPLPPGVSFEAGAVATDACMTAHHAVVDRVRVKRGDTVLIVGLGGLGFNALQIALSKGARVIVTDQRQVVLDEAEKVGVQNHDIIPADTPNPSEWIRDKGVIIDSAIDFCGTKQTFETAVASVRKAGTVVVVGLLGPELSLVTGTIVRKQLNILGSYGGTIENIKDCLNLIQRGVLVPQVTKGKMEDFPAILDDLHNGKIVGRMVMLPG